MRRPSRATIGAFCPPHGQNAPHGRHAVRSTTSLPSRGSPSPPPPRRADARRAATAAAARSLSPCCASRRDPGDRGEQGVRGRPRRPTRGGARSSTWRWMSGSTQGLRCERRREQRRRVEPSRRESPVISSSRPTSRSCSSAMSGHSARAPARRRAAGSARPRRVGLEERHLERRDHRARRTASRRASRAQLAEVASLSAVPAPYQDGSSSRFCVHAKTHGIARSASTPPAPPARDGGREPMLSSRQLGDRRRLREEAQEVVVLVDQRRGSASRERVGQRAGLIAVRAGAGGSGRRVGGQQHRRGRLLQRAQRQLRVRRSARTPSRPAR